MPQAVRMAGGYIVLNRLLLCCEISISVANRTAIEHHTVLQVFMFLCVFQPLGLVASPAQKTGVDKKERVWVWSTIFLGHSLQTPGKREKRSWKAAFSSSIFWNRGRFCKNENRNSEVHHISIYEEGKDMIWNWNLRPLSNFHVSMSHPFSFSATKAAQPIVPSEWKSTPQVFLMDFEKLENRSLGKLGWTCPLPGLPSWANHIVDVYLQNIGRNGLIQQLCRNQQCCYSQQHFSNQDNTCILGYMQENKYLISKSNQDNTCILCSMQETKDLI